MLGADYGLATISFREGEAIEKELIAYDLELSKKLGKAREEVGRLEKEVHIHELKLEQLPLGQLGTLEETPEDIYRRRIKKYNVILEQETGVFDIPEELPPFEYEGPETEQPADETGTLEGAPEDTDAGGTPPADETDETEESLPPDETDETEESPPSDETDETEESPPSDETDETEESPPSDETESESDSVGEGDTSEESDTAD